MTDLSAQIREALAAAKRLGWTNPITLIATAADWEALLADNDRLRAVAEAARDVNAIAQGAGWTGVQWRYLRSKLAALDALRQPAGEPDADTERWFQTFRPAPKPAGEGQSHEHVWDINGDTLICEVCGAHGELPAGSQPEGSGE